MKKGVLYIEDILKELSEEKGIPLKIVKNLWKIVQDYEKKLMEDPEVYHIQLPFIGNLTYGVRYAQLEKTFQKKKRNYKEPDRRKEVVNSLTQPKKYYRYYRLPRLFYRMRQARREGLLVPGMKKRRLSFKDAVKASEEWSYGRMEENPDWLPYEEFKEQAAKYKEGLKNKKEE